MPSFGADMEDAVFVKWNVQPGQAVRRGDIACIVETQKGAIDVEVWQDGTLARVLTEPGQRIPVGQALAVLATEGEDWQSVAASAVPAAPAVPAPAEASGKAAAVRASPAARKRAAELGIELGQLERRRGDEPITLEDVERMAATGPAPADSMRAAIAAAMARSKREIPHYYLGCELNVEPAMLWLEAFNSQRAVNDRVLFAAVALKAIALAVHQAPELNGRFSEGRFQAAAGVHLGVVTSLRSGGLVVPTVHDADRLSVPALMAALRDTLARARSGQLRSSDLADSTLTVSNLGDLGCDTVYGVIYPPQVALVGLGRVIPRPVVHEGTVMAARTVELTLAADHRASDGLIGARFLGAVGDRLAHPEEL